MHGKQSLVVGIALTRLVCTLLGLSTPFLYKIFMDHVIMNNDTRYLIYVILGYVILYIAMTVFSVAGCFYESKLKNKLHVDLKKRLLTVYRKMDVGEYEKYNIGDLRNRVETDVTRLETFYTSHIIDYSFAIISIIILIMIMLMINWVLALFGMLGIGITFISTNVVGAKLNIMSDSYRADYGEFESVILHSLHNWKEIKANNLEKHQEKLLDEKWVDIAQLMKKQAIYKYLSTAFVALNLFVVTRLGMYFLGGILVFNNLIDVASLLVFITYYDKLRSEMDTLTKSIVQFAEDSPLMKRVMEIHKLTIDSELSSKAIGCLEVNNVSFRYEGDKKDTLYNVNFQIPKRKHIAVVGKSGCGKTTLAKIMLGLIKPYQGNVNIGGENITGFTDKAKSKVICAVMQDPKFFNLSIADNLRLIKADVSQEEMDEVCRMANIYEFIQKLPQKYETVIGERGVKLSGGQLQRLAIARTLLRNPDIIIFDEATSSLDNDNEKAVITAISNLASRKTIISIAHRFASIMEADKVFFLKEGRVIAQGSVSELMEKCEEFRELYMQQIY